MPFFTRLVGGFVLAGREVSLQHPQSGAGRARSSDRVAPRLPGRPAAPTEVRHFTEIIFARYNNDVAPKYVFEQAER
jgi:hypothetical protein